MTSDTKKSSKQAHHQYAALVTYKNQLLPDFLLQQIWQVEQKCFMGILSDLLWVSFDNRLFLVTKEGVCCLSYDAQDIIVLVEQSKDKLYIGTRSDMTVLVYQDNQLFDPDLKVTYSADVCMLTCYTVNDDVYFGGSDGSLYLMKVQQEETWFTRKCSLQNLTRTVSSYLLPSFLSSKQDAVIGICSYLDFVYTLSQSGYVSKYRNKMYQSRQFVGKDCIGMHSYSSSEVLVVQSSGQRVLVSDTKQSSMPLQLQELSTFDVSFYEAGTLILGGASANGNAIVFSGYDEMSGGDFTMFNISEDRIQAIRSLIKLDSMYELSTQVVQKRAEVIILTNKGIYEAYRKRPVESFMECLHGGAQSKEMQDFIQHYGDEQVCAMALAVACDNTNINVKDSQLKSSASLLFYQRASLNKFQFETRFEGGFSTQSESYSTGYHSIILYFGRIAKKIWFSNITQFKKQETGHLVRNLSSLKDFVTHYIKAGSDLQERPALQSVLKLLTLTIEGVNCLAIIVPEKVESLLSRLRAEDVQYTKSSNIGMLLTSSRGMQLIKEITHTLMTEVISRNTTVDSICHDLQLKCPSFFNASDYQVYKAKQLLHSIPLRRSSVDALLQQSSEMLIQASHQMSIVQVSQFVDIYRTYGAPEYAVRLCLAVQFDPEGHMVRYVQGEMDEYTESVRLTLQCYQMVFDVVTELVRQQKTSQDLQRMYKGHPVFVVIYNSKSDVFLELFFDHLAQLEQLVHLLRVVPSGHIGNKLQLYLQRREYQRSEFGLYLCLLLRSQKNYSAAVHKLYEYSCSAEFPASLNKRIEMLTMAMSLVETNRDQVDEDIRRDISDMLDVANVQWLLARSLPGVQHLQTSVLTVTELFILASEYDLDECKFAVLSVSDGGNQLLQGVWNSVLEKYYTDESQFYAIINAVMTKYANNDNVAPLSVVVPLIESFMVEKQVKVDEPLWLPQLLQHAKIPFRDIWSTYHQMFKTRQAPYSDKHGQVYLLRKILMFLALNKHEHYDTAAYTVFLSNHEDQKLSAQLAQVKK